MGTVHYLRNSDRRRRPTPRRRRSNHEPSRLSKSESAHTADRVSIIPFPEHRTAAGRAQARKLSQKTRSPLDKLRPLLLVLSIGSLSLGFAGVHDLPWLSYLQIVTGLLGLIEAGTKLHASRGRRWLLGWAAQAIAIFAYLEGVRGWAIYWTLAFGIGFLLSARRPRAKPRRFDRGF